jgi:hypothetical protein
MQKVKVLYLIAVLALLAISVVMFSGIAQAGAVPEGFMGVPWGATRDRVIKAMSEQGYRQLTSEEPSNLKFRGNFANCPCILSFSLIANSFYRGGAENCAKGPYRQAAQLYLERIVNMLSEKYGPLEDRDYSVNNSAKDEKQLEAGGPALYYAYAQWHLVDSRTSDKYSINVFLYRSWFADGTLNYVVGVSYRADSLEKRLEKKEY